MAETGEKYTVARRMVIAAAQDGAIRGAVQQSLERLVGLSAVDVDLAADRVHVTIRAARPGMAWALLRPAEGEGVWRDSAAERLRAELEELTGRRVRLDILQVDEGSSPDEGSLPARASYRARASSSATACCEPGRLRRVIATMGATARHQARRRSTSSPDAKANAVHLVSTPSRPAPSSR